MGTMGPSSSSSSSDSDGSSSSNSSSEDSAERRRKKRKREKRKRDGGAAATAARETNTRKRATLPEDWCQQGANHHLCAPGQACTSCGYVGSGATLDALRDFLLPLQT